MARGGILLLLALLSGATTTIPSAKAQQQQVASNSTSDVQVATIDVEGEVMMYISHKHALSNETELEPTQRSELTYKLFDTSPSDAPRDFLTVDFGETSASLRTGDVVNARLTLNISADMAAQLDLTTSGLDNSSSRRRRLSEMHDAARRMVLDLHGTRRSVQEVLAVREALHRIGMTSFGLKSEATSVIGRASGKDILVTNDMQQNMSSITFVVKLSACGMIPALNASRVAEFLFDNSKINGNLERWYKECTYNQVTFRREANLIFDLDLPCSGITDKNRTFDLKMGVSNGVNYDNELYGLVDLAYSWMLKNQPGVRWSNYRKIFIFPFNWYLTRAYWDGMASMGCIGPDLSFCYTWINTGLSDQHLQISTIVQELNHNIGLAHSARMSQLSNNRWSAEEYGDEQCPMGRGRPEVRDQQIVCTNAAQSYKAGWAKPIPGGHIDAYDLIPGVTQQFTLSSMHLGKNNILRIIYDKSNRAIDNISAPATQEAVFVSYRVRQSAPGSYDSGLHPELDRRVWINMYNIRFNGYPAAGHEWTYVMSVMTDDKPLPYIRKSWWGTANRSFTQMLPTGSVGGFTITIKSKTDTHANVTLCRFLTSVESKATGSLCNDGVDNDCDGLVDMDDPDCNESPPPSPPSPRPGPPPPFSPSSPQQYRGPRRISPSPPPPRLIIRMSPPPPRPAIAIRSSASSSKGYEYGPAVPPAAGSAAHCHICCLKCIFLAVLCAVLQRLH